MVESTKAAIFLDERVVSTSEVENDCIRNLGCRHNRVQGIAKNSILQPL